MENISKFEGFESKNTMGDSAIILAARDGVIESLKKYFSILTNLTNVETAVDLLSHHCNKYGKGLLHESAQNSRVDCVKYLLDEVGLHPDCLKQADWTPLMLSCTKNNLDIVKLLVNKGADLSLKNKDGWTAFHIACREGNVEIIKFLLNQGEEIWKTKSKNGRTPLHTVALYGRLEVANLLLTSASFPVDKPDSCGSTPLMDALRSGHIDIAKLLVRLQNADWTKTDSLGREPLHLAAQTGQCQSILWLIDEMSVHTDTRTKSTLMTAAHFAAKENHVDVLKVLKDKNADLFLFDANGRSALHLAASGQHAKCVKYLLTNGLKDNLDSFERYAADYAKKPDVINAFVS